MTERKLASIQVIAEKKPIKGADLIEAIRVNGWWLVAKKGEFDVGDLCVYFEIDSFLPVRPEFEFLRKSSFKSTAHLGDGFRLRTIKLKGQISQGLALPISSFLFNYLPSSEGTDVTERLGIQKWETPIAPQMVGQVKGSFPSFIPKTDQERCQNLVDEIKEAYDSGELFETTIKLDGSSCTVYYNNGVIGICSRNLELKMNEENKDNLFIKTIIESKLLEALGTLRLNIAVQGELMGPGVQGNREGLKKNIFFVYDIFDIDSQRHLLPDERNKVYFDLHLLGHDAYHVPILDSVHLSSCDIDGLLQYAEGPSFNPDVKREGIVFKSYSRGFSFKAIANSYLLDEK